MTMQAASVADCDEPSVATTVSSTDHNSSKTNGGISKSKARSLRRKRAKQRLRSRNETVTPSLSNGEDEAVCGIDNNDNDNKIVTSTPAVEKDSQPPSDSPDSRTKKKKKTKKHKRQEPTSDDTGMTENGPAHTLSTLKKTQVSPSASPVSVQGVFDLTGEMKSFEVKPLPREENTNATDKHLEDSLPSMPPTATDDESRANADVLRLESAKNNTVEIKMTKQDVYYDDNEQKSCEREKEKCECAGCVIS